ncbi:MAG: HAMP domain-containing sensor histidine kinase [Roseiarcus sp.]
MFRTTSFRLTAIYLVVFAMSTLALGAFVYESIRREVREQFDDRILEESNALSRIFLEQGRDRLSAVVTARGSGGGALAYGLLDPGCALLAGEIPAQPPAFRCADIGWVELQENDEDEAPEGAPERIRALVTRLPDRSSLIVGDELRRPDAVMRDILWVFGWSIASMVGLGVAGGLWLSAQFLRRIDTMRIAAQGMMAGDWSRRIPSSAINDDLSSLAETFNRLFDRIEKLMLANKHVSADIAHDLRKPLARTLRRLEAARDDQAPHSAAAFETAIVDIEGVLETFNALLRIGQIEAGARRAAFRPVDLAMIVRNVVEAFQPAAEQEGKLLVVRLDSSLPVQGDKDLLSQMVANLIDNALRHTPSGVRIEVAGKLTASGGLRLSVSDNGPGVASHELNSIFKRFYRAESARQTAGTGLGLSLVAAIAELHGLNTFASDNGPGLRIEIVTEHRT